MLGSRVLDRRSAARSSAGQCGACTRRRARLTARPARADVTAR